MSSRWVLVAAMVALSACATELASGMLERTEASIRTAEEVGAVAVPEARLHLQYARDETAKARELSEKGDERAGVMLARARADADLAVALTRERAMHADATRADEQLRALQQRRTP